MDLVLLTLSKEEIRVAPLQHLMASKRQILRIGIKRVGAGLPATTYKQWPESA